MDMAQNRFQWRIWPTYGATQSWVACQKWRRRGYVFASVCLSVCVCLSVTAITQKVVSEKWRSIFGEVGCVTCRNWFIDFWRRSGYRSGYRNYFNVICNININIIFLYCADPYCKIDGALHGHYIVCYSEQYDWRGTFSVLDEKQLLILFFSVQSAAGSMLAVQLTN